MLQANELNNAETHNAKVRSERELLERHFQTVADLAAAKILYPIAFRDLLAIVSQQQK